MKPRCSSIPALRNVEGAWEFDATGKAELFANTFKSKYKLIPSEENEYTKLQDVELRQLHQNLPPEKEAAAILKTLKADSATALDMLPARILKECCLQLACPLRMLAQSIFNFGAWPRSWMVHWIVPLLREQQFSHQEIIGYISHRRFQKPWNDFLD